MRYVILNFIVVIVIIIIIIIIIIIALLNKYVDRHFGLILI